MIIKTELTDEKPSHWPSSIVPNTSLSVSLSLDGESTFVYVYLIDC